MQQLILGSSSPRRQEILRDLSIPFTIRKPELDESSVSLTDPVAKVRKLALLKARDISIESDHEIILTADTVVAYKNTIFEKPNNKQEAYQMISTLSGRKHDVITAFALRTHNREKVFSVKTQVYFWELTDAEVNAYISTTEPYDKAGAYGIQGKASVFVEKIEGDYFNVVGLPISYVIKELRHFNFNVNDYIFNN